MSAATPFRIAVPDTVLARIRERVSAFDWGAMADAGGWSAGTAIADMHRLCEYWLDHYDWRKAEATLNHLPQFRATIDEQIIHFVHMSRDINGAKRRVMILTHGWPGSFFEFADIAEQIVWPERFGGDAADGIDIVVPSLPGYGFSGRPPRTVSPRYTARLWHRLATDVLGYPYYVAQGGDWGATVSAWLAHDHAAHCEGLHLNSVLVQTKGVKPENAEEKAIVDRLKNSMLTESGYSALQGTRPQTLSYAMNDSPVGVAAWIVEKFAAWSDLPRIDGEPVLWARYTEDTLLTNIMIYLVTNSFGTASWMYKGRRDDGTISFPAGSRVRVPTAVANFPEPAFPTIARSQAMRSYDIVSWTDMPRGGHFAALEEPTLLLESIRAFLRLLAASDHPLPDRT